MVLLLIHTNLKKYINIALWQSYFYKPTGMTHFSFEEASAGNRKAGAEMCRPKSKREITWLLQVWPLLKMATWTPGEDVNQTWVDQRRAARVWRECSLRDFAATKQRGIKRGESFSWKERGNTCQRSQKIRKDWTLFSIVFQHHSFIQNWQRKGEHHYFGGSCLVSQ